MLKADTELIGRSKEIEELTKLIKKRRDVLLVGHLGSGKTAILERIYNEFNGNGKHRILCVKESTPLKDTLIQIAYQIHDKYRDLRLWEVDDQEMVVQEWKDVKRKVTRMKIRDLAGVVLRSIHKKDYIVILDHLERVTPTAKSVMEILLDRCCVVGSYSGYPQNAGNLRKLWWRFKKIEIKNLTKEETLQLIDYYFERYNILVENPGWFKKAIWKKTQGNPLAIKDLCHAGSLERYVDKHHIREIAHDAGTRYLDATPFVILGLAGFVMLRFFALGMNDQDTYVFAGSLGALGLFIRFILFRYLRN